MRPLALTFVIVLLAGCKPTAADPAPSCEALSAGRVLVVRPDSTSLLWLPETGELAAWSARGVERWRTRLEEGAVLGAPAVAPDSTVFVRTPRALLAFGADGRLLWRRELPVGQLPPGLLGPAALRDSGAVAATAADRLELLAPDGRPRCRIALPSGTRLSAAPGVAPDGTVLVAVDEALLAYDAHCAPRWQRPSAPPGGEAR